MDVPSGGRGKELEVVGDTPRDEGQGLQDIWLQAFPFGAARRPPRAARRGAGGSPLGGAGRGNQQHQGQGGEGTRVSSRRNTSPTPVRDRDPYGVRPRQHGGTDPPAGVQRGTGGCRAQAEHPPEPGPILRGVLSIQGWGGTLSSTPLPFCRGRRDSALRELPCAGQRWTTGSATPPEPPLSGQTGQHLREGLGALPRGCGEGPPPAQDPLPALQRTAPRVAPCQ